MENTQTQAKRNQSEMNFYKTLHDWQSGILVCQIFDLQIHGQMVSKWSSGEV